MMYLTSRLPAAASASLRSVSRIARPAALRTLTTTVARLDEQSPVFQGKGAAPGEMPTDEDQSTGLERFELYGKMEGVDVFEMDPLPADRLGTVKDPVKVRSMVSISEPTNI
ncbi:Cytochrome c oxidase subunit 4 [Malassezia psittaci]|uniref:Cytochrome c oxidase subunit 4 n=1 Tax=Malassezia psittaci TaxID=1821823 RepID=A0AAF0FCG5_9BASI|nr:Cytochrome c oxidase subunit 4 [Malassezia psittaci]